ncbi:TadE family protein [Streptomyces sp. AM 3-1-1]|uniref:TadE/TadG family type IV pilus assembly protein n=1 Tax=Streptomyces sp. AM 3-1-1 TaxID=3028711 RepID=UPI0023B9DC4D|nr:TadE family protein [Streptomyces sp. AM 3-1-1]WEH29551.1 pilus assembly protein [Streptomyces sp. AM 3-1-1]
MTGAAHAVAGGESIRTGTGRRHARTPGSRAARPTARRARDDRGSSLLEFAGFLPVLLLVGLAAIQLGLVGFAANQAGTGARAGARVASQAEGGNGVAAAHAAMTDGLDATVTPGGGGDTTTYTVAVRVPTLLPFVGKGWTVTRSATMPNDDTGEVTLP